LGHFSLRELLYPTEPHVGASYKPSVFRKPSR
jgi:hypothetical protein